MTLEECRQLKKYEIKDYWKLIGQGILVKPQDFGRIDYYHDEDGKVDYWIPPNPNEDLSKLNDDNSIPFEKQKYDDRYDDSRLDNLRNGWDRIRIIGAINDYWKMREEWN